MSEAHAKGIREALLITISAVAPIICTPYTWCCNKYGSDDRSILLGNTRLLSPISSLYLKRVTSYDPEKTRFYPNFVPNSFLCFSTFFTFSFGFYKKTVKLWPLFSYFFEFLKNTPEAGFLAFHISRHILKIPPWACF